MSTIDDFVNGKNGQAESCAMDAGIPLPDELGIFQATRDAVFRIRYHEYTTGAIAAENLAQLIEKEIDVAEEEIRELRKRAEWQPIKTYDKKIENYNLLLLVGGIAEVGMRYADGFCDATATNELHPTHWMPLPEPPEERAG